MKHFLPLALVAFLAGCAGTRPQAVTPVAVNVADEVQVPVTVNSPTNPIVLARDSWSITFPPDWRVDAAAVAVGNTKQAFEAFSGTDVGRAPTRVTLNTLPFDGPPEAFVLMAGALAAQSFTGGQVKKQGNTDFNGHLASLTILELPDNIGMIVMSFAFEGTAYVLTCGGDIASAIDSHTTTQACISVLKTFTVK